jgi:hypothetical protein
MALQTLLQHIEISTQPQIRTNARKTLAGHLLRKQERIGKLLHRGAHLTAGDPHLMQRLRVAIGQHIQLQGHQPLGLTSQQLGREGPAALTRQRFSVIHGSRPEKAHSEHRGEVKELRQGYEIKANVNC